MNGPRIWLPVMLWAAMIFALSSMPDLTPNVELFPYSDKLAHFMLYAPLGYFLMRATSLHSGPMQDHPLLWAVILGVLYGLADEIHQAFVPGRTMDPFDWLADGLGVVAGVLWQQRIGSKKAKQA